MGFSGLKMFGPQLIHHTQLKIRGNIAMQDFMIVDTPGMIDSPTPRINGHLGGQVSINQQDRGYDFEGVCRWYAERADVILLFFDPDKPGNLFVFQILFFHAPKLVPRNIVSLVLQERLVRHYRF